MNATWGRNVDAQGEQGSPSTFQKPVGSGQRDVRPFW